MVPVELPSIELLKLWFGVEWGSVWFKSTELTGGSGRVGSIGIDGIVGIVDIIGIFKESKLSQNS